MKNELKVKYEDENVKIEIIRIAAEDGRINNRCYVELFESQTLSALNCNTIRPLLSGITYSGKTALQRYPDVVICEIWSKELDMMGDEVVFAYNTEIDRWVRLSDNLSYGFEYIDIFENLLVNVEDDVCHKLANKIYAETAREFGDDIEKYNFDIDFILNRDNQKTIVIKYYHTYNLMAITPLEDGTYKGECNGLIYMFENVEDLIDMHFAMARQ